jgi:hypothetical protein
MLTDEQKALLKGRNFGIVATVVPPRARTSTSASCLGATPARSSARRSTA